jgi:Cellulase (glycosyl hydrolase family 5)
LCNSCTLFSIRHCDVLPKIVIAMILNRLTLYKKSILFALLFDLFCTRLPGCMSIYKSDLPLASIVYGVNVDMTAMIPGTPYTITTAGGGNFFDLATQLGINTLRITDVQWEMTGKEYSQSDWHYVFDEAVLHHIRIILLLMGGGEHTAIEQAHILLDQYHLAYAPALWLVDLANEPDVDDSQQMAAIREEAAYVRQITPGVPLTIGGWKSQIPGQPGQFDWQDQDDIPKFIDLVDVVSPHLYQFEIGSQQGFTPQQWTQRFLSATRLQAGHKPILLGEFGAGNGLAATTGPTPAGSFQWQEYVYQGVLQEVKKEHSQNVIGAVAWMIAPRPGFPPGPDNYEGDMSGWAFVLNQGQRLLPAAKQFSVIEHAPQ